MSSGNGRGGKVAFLWWKRQDLATNRMQGKKEGKELKRIPRFQGISENIGGTKIHYHSVSTSPETVGTYP